MLAAAAPLLLAFWRFERKLEIAGGDPIVPPGLLQVPGLMRGLLAALFFYVVAAFWLIFSIYQQEGLGRTPFASGLAILPAAAGFSLGPFFSGRVLKVFGRYAAAAGMGVQAVGLAATAVMNSAGVPRFLFIALFLVGVGQGIALPSLVQTVVRGIDKTRSGLASGLVNDRRSSRRCGLHGVDEHAQRGRQVPLSSIVEIVGRQPGPPAVENAD